MAPTHEHPIPPIVGPGPDEIRRGGRVLKARAIVAVMLLAYAAWTCTCSLFVLFFYRLGDFGDCFSPTPCTTTAPPDPRLIALGVGAAAIAFLVGALVAIWPIRRVFALTLGIALILAVGSIAIGALLPNAWMATLGGTIAVIAVLGSGLGWHNSRVVARS
jgi:hypothetical protein